MATAPRYYNLELAADLNKKRPDRAAQDLFNKHPIVSQWETPRTDNTDENRLRPTKYNGVYQQTSGLAATGSYYPVNLGGPTVAHVSREQIGKTPFVTGSAMRFSPDRFTNARHRSNMSDIDEIVERDFLMRRRGQHQGQHPLTQVTWNGALMPAPQQDERNYFERFDAGQSTLPQRQPRLVNIGMEPRNERQVAQVGALHSTQYAPELVPSYTLRHTYRQRAPAEREPYPLRTSGRANASAPQPYIPDKHTSRIQYGGMDLARIAHSTPGGAKAIHTTPQEVVVVNSGYVISEVAAPPNKHENETEKIYNDIGSNFNRIRYRDGAQAPPPNSVVYSGAPRDTYNSDYGFNTVAAITHPKRYSAMNESMPGRRLLSDMTIGGATKSVGPRTGSQTDPNTRIIRTKRLPYFKPHVGSAIDTHAQNRHDLIEMYEASVAHARRGSSEAHIIQRHVGDLDQYARTRFVANTPDTLNGLGIVNPVMPRAPRTFNNELDDKMKLHLALGDPSNVYVSEYKRRQIMLSLAK